MFDFLMASRVQVDYGWHTQYLLYFIKMEHSPSCFSCYTIYLIIGTRSKWELMGQRIDIKCIVV